jgi:hypothetical protein
MPVRVTLFKGNTPGMNGHVFQCHDERGDSRQYGRTIDALEEYVKKNMKSPEDLASLFGTTMTAPVLSMPEDLPTQVEVEGRVTVPGPTETARMIWTEEVKDYFKRNKTMKSNLAALYAVAWGQCSDPMRAKLKSLGDHEASARENDCFWLFNNIKATTLQFDERRNGFISLLDARASFLNCRQGPDQTPDAYLEVLRGWADAIEYYGGTVAENHSLVSATSPDGSHRRNTSIRGCVTAYIKFCVDAAGALRHIT